MTKFKHMRVNNQRGPASFTMASKQIFVIVIYKVPRAKPDPPENWRTNRSIKGRANAQLLNKCEPDDLTKTGNHVKPIVF